MPHLLIADDDPALCQLLGRYLTQQGFTVTVAGHIAEVRHLRDLFIVDMLILDVMMPDITGVSYAQACRATGDTIPILLLTALAESENRIAGLQAGVDDYLPKPFEPEELVLRIKAILRRQPSVNASDRLILNGCSYYTNSQQLRDDATSQRIALSATEQAALHYLAQHHGCAVPRDTLAAAIGQLETDSTSRALDVLITRLRRKIGDTNKPPQLLQAIRGVGYRLQGH